MAPFLPSLIRRSRALFGRAEFGGEPEADCWRGFKPVLEIDTVDDDHILPKALCLALFGL